MTAWITISALSLALCVFAGWLVPAWAMKRLMPALESGGKRVTNFRGRSVPTGLGIVWLVWAAAVACTVGIATSLVPLSLAAPGPWIPDVWISAIMDGPLATIAPVTPVLLVAGTAAFGMVDDLFGDTSARGFHGHLSALAHGRMTTGGLKLLGIGGLSLAAALPLTISAFFDAPETGFLSRLPWLATWLLAALVIALSANLVNLTDLRPGRALKVYGALAVCGLAIAAVSLWSARDGMLQTLSNQSLPLWLQFLWIGVVKLSLLALVFGPVLAVWSYDLGERAMLGDAGANAMGALAGFLLAWRSPLWLLAVLAVVLLALNLVSERVSFTGVIERVGFLKWLDGLGRLPVDDPVPMGAPTGAPGVDASDSGHGE